MTVASDPPDARHPLAPPVFPCHRRGVFCSDDPVEHPLPDRPSVGRRTASSAAGPLDAWRGAKDASILLLLHAALAPYAQRTERRPSPMQKARLHVEPGFQCATEPLYRCEQRLAYASRRRRSSSVNSPIVCLPRAATGASGSASMESSAAESFSLRSP